MDFLLGVWPLCTVYKFEIAFVTQASLKLSVCEVA